MATMYQKCMNDLVDRIAAQAVEIAQLKHDKAYLAKRVDERAAAYPRLQAWVRRPWLRCLTG